MTTDPPPPLPLHGEVGSNKEEGGTPRGRLPPPRAGVRWTRVVWPRWCLTPGGVFESISQTPLASGPRARNLYFRGFGASASSKTLSALDSGAGVGGQPSPPPRQAPSPAHKAPVSLPLLAFTLLLTRNLLPQLPALQNS